MSKLSGIPQAANKYATKCAYVIRNKEFEVAKGINFRYSKVSAESEFIEGLSSGIPYNPATHPSNLFVHNHPLGSDLSIMDIFLAIHTGIKKIFASTKQGFTAMDLTTAKKNISKKDMRDWILEAHERFRETTKTKWYETLTQEELERQQSIIHQTLKEFAKFSGATMSDVKWSDYRQLRPKP